MATAKEARAWARSTLRGIGNSLYTPFCGDDGDDIDWDAYRTLVRYCVGELRHPMLWCTSGVGEFWSLTLDERKRLLEVAIEEGRAANPDVVVQACTAAMSAKDCLELTRHAQEAGADVVYIQTPMMEAHGGIGVLRYFQYIADRTDIALGMFNSPSSGYVLTPAESARIYDEIPAVCATKEGAFRPAYSRLPPVPWTEPVSCRYSRCSGFAITAISFNSHVRTAPARCFGAGSLTPSFRPARGPSRARGSTRRWCPARCA